MQYSTERATAQDGMKMITNSATDIIERLIEGGLEEKYARIILALCGQAPMKASEIGKRMGLSRMDAYNSLKKLQEKGLVKATLDKPIRFFGMSSTAVASIPPALASVEVIIAVAVAEIGDVTACIECTEA